MSSKYKTNYQNPSMDPWGTPQTVGSGLESVFSKVTCWDGSNR